MDTISRKIFFIISQLLLGSIAQRHQFPPRWPCCPKIVYEGSPFHGGTYNIQEGVFHNHFPVYKQEQGDKFMVACPYSNRWVIADADYTTWSLEQCRYYQYVQAQLRLHHRFTRPLSPTYCPEDAPGPWRYSDGSVVPGSRVRCSDCERFPRETECDPSCEDIICTADWSPVCGADGKTYSNTCRACGVKVACDGECPCSATCCNKVNLTSTNSEWLATRFYMRRFHGGWTATGITINGKSEYRSDNNNRFCLWFNTNNEWMINRCGPGGRRGFIFGDGPAGMKCPEQATGWRFLSQNGNGWIQDRTMRTTCNSVDPCSEPFAVVGHCEAALSSWSYNQETGQCEHFLYGGCGGNNNNFRNREQCQWTCENTEWVDGRPFIVDGKSRTTSSKICTNSGTDDEILSQSWRQGRDPSVPPGGLYNRDMGMYWLRKAEGEHASVASFARHTLQLMSMGAPARLLVASQEASLDEIKHAKMCYGIASAFLGAGTGPGSLDVTDSLESMEIKEIVQSVIVEGCIGETLSAIEAHFAAHYAQDGAVKEALEEIAVDETRHGQLAWDTIEWILQKQPEIRNFVNDVFQDEFDKLIVPAINDTAFHGSLLCEESEKKITLRSFGLLDEDDRSKVRKVGVRDIIEPVYRDGIKNVNIISKRIMELNIIDL